MGRPIANRTIEQKQAEADAKLARLRTQTRRLENGQKIILGGMLIAAAKRDPKVAAWLIKEAHQHVTREIDAKRLAPLIDEIDPGRETVGSTGHIVVAPEENEQ